MATPIPANRAPLTAWAAAAATGGVVVRVEGEGRRAVGITADSRAVTPGCAFVALRGETHDGHAFVSGAIEAGAALVVVERGRAPEGTQADVVEVDDTLAAWGELARAHLRAWRRGRGERDAARVVAVTGSAGKTTTKELCASILRVVAPCHATAGNLNNLVGVPAVVFGLEPQHRFAVLEVGMSVRGEIARLADLVEPDVAIVTNVGVAHAEGVGGSRGDVAREKGALYAALRRRAVAVANADDEAVLGQLTRTRADRVLTFGRAEGATYRLVDRVPAGATGSRVTLACPGRPRLELDFALLGEAAAIDLAAALAAAEAASGAAVPAAMLQGVLSRHAAIAGRTAVRRLKDDTLLIDDTYNANPHSMRAALAAAAELGRAHGARVVAVLGEMKELGPSAPAEHAALGDAVADAGVALAVGCGGLVDLALDRAAARGVAIEKAQDTAQAALRAVAVVAPGDVVLVKGSRGVRAERVVEALVAARGEVLAVREEQA
jgi:UDP-N-acetylmuramoyl-tripeptide--D-alanyl-D-alanine ligase